VETNGMDRWSRIKDRETAKREGRGGEENMERKYIEGP
jgi:hypothetical protein